MLSVAATAGISAIAALLAAVVTAMLTRRREHEADWRRLKRARYQEFVLALSGETFGRASAEAHRRYADAVKYGVGCLDRSCWRFGPFKVKSAI